MAYATAGLQHKQGRPKSVLSRGGPGPPPGSKLQGCLLLNCLIAGQGWAPGRGAERRREGSLSLQATLGKAARRRLARAASGPPGSRVFRVSSLSTIPCHIRPPPSHLGKLLDAILLFLAADPCLPGSLLQPGHLSLEKLQPDDSGMTHHQHQMRYVCCQGIRAAQSRHTAHSARLPAAPRPKKPSRTARCCTAPAPSSAQLPAATWPQHTASSCCMSPPPQQRTSGPCGTTPAQSTGRTDATQPAAVAAVGQPQHLPAPRW